MPLFLRKNNFKPKPLDITIVGEEPQPGVPLLPYDHKYTIDAIVGLKEALELKQDALVSGQTIKRLNGIDLVGSGDIYLGGGSGGGVTAGNKGDIVVQSNDSWVIDTGAVTNAKLAGGISPLKITQDALNRFFTDGERTKLSGVAAGATANSTDATLLNRSNHTGTQSADTLTDGTTNKVFLATEKTKLAGVQTGATANDTDVNLKNRTNHTGTQAATTVVEDATHRFFTDTERTKLTAVAAGATANSTDAVLLSRANHTGTQLSTTISDFTESVQDAVAALLVPGTNVGVVYDDVNNTLTISATPGSSGLDPEQVRDVIGACISGVGNVSVTYNDAADTIIVTTTATQNSTDAALRDRSTHTGTQSADTLTDGTTNKAYTAAEKTKLAGIAAGATANSTDATLLSRANHTGTQLSSTISDFPTATDARITALRNAINGILGLDASGKFSADFIIDGTTNKAYTATEKTKLGGIAAGATANSTDAVLLNRVNHTGTQLASTISDFSTAADARISAQKNVASGILGLDISTKFSADFITDGTTNKAYTAAEKTKLAGIQTGATANSTDAALRDRSTHTGTQLSSTISDFATAADARITAQKNVASGLAGLDVNSKLSADTITDGTTNKAYTATEKTKLAGIAAGATANATDTFLLDRTNHTGTQSATTVVEDATHRFFTDTERTKLTGVQAGATANSTDVTLLNRVNHTGTQAATTVVEDATHRFFTDTERTKLTGVAAGATANSADATLLNRTNHTGTQTSATISDLTEFIQDTVAGLLGAGSNVILNYDDAANSLSISATGSGGSGLDAEQVRDVIGIAMVGVGNIAVVVNDAADTITITTTATVNSTDSQLRDRSTHTGTQSADTITDGTTNKAYTATEKTKLSGIQSGATANSTDAVLLNRANHTGTQTAATISDFSTAADARITALRNAINGILGLDAAGKFSADYIIDGTTNKAYTATEKTKLTGVAPGATANSTDTFLLSRTNHTGTQAATTIVEDATHRFFTDTERTKLTGVAAGATVNSTDATLLARANHTGTQLSSTISDFSTATDSRVNTQKNVASGILGLDSNTKVSADFITDGTTNKAYTAAEKTKLSGVAAGATANSTDSFLLDRTNHTGTQAATTVVEDATHRFFTDTERTKLAGVAAGATANDTDVNLKNRANHTGTQLASTISDFTEAAQDAIASLLVAGSNVGVVYDDVNNTLTISATPGSTGLSAEDVRDVIGATIVGVGNISVVNNDAADTITVSTTATVNSTDASLRDRSTHTGTQLASTISDFSTAADARISAQKNVANGIAGLDASSKLSADTIIDGTTNKAYTATEKTKLAGVAAGATQNSTDTFLLNRTNHTGTQAATTVVEDATHRFFTDTERTKLTGVAAGATANSSDAVLLARANHTGTQSADTLTDGTTNKAFLATERTKLAGIAAGATVNSTDATLLNRANHTGTQLASTISDFSTAADARISAQKNVASGILALDTNTKFSADFIIDGTTNKAYTATEKTKLSGIAAGATQNSTDAQLRDRSTHTGTQAATTVVEDATHRFFTDTERTKLTGVAAGATANSTDAVLLARANHTGTQTAATISDFSTAADARIALASIDAFADVLLTTPINGQVLKYNGTTWVNSTPPAADVTDGNKGVLTVTSGIWTLNTSSVSDDKIVSISSSKITGIIDASHLPPVNFPDIDFVNVGTSGSTVIRIAPGKQAHTTGSSVTVAVGKKWLIVNPASTLSTLNITLPSSAIDGQDCEISFGGTLTSGTVVTNITITPNTNTTILQRTPPSLISVGDVLKYRFEATNSIWYRIL